MDDNQLDKDNPEYNKIRHFKSTWKDYVDFWEKKGARMTPWKEWDQEYPSKAKMKKSDPVHSYKTFDDESVKEFNHVEEPQNLEIYNNNFKTFESFKSELNEDNPVAISGSQEDKLPTGKPFVIRSKKKRKGSNEDDDDETQEVANMNTSNVGSK